MPVVLPDGRCRARRPAPRARCYRCGAGERCCRAAAARRRPAHRARPRRARQLAAPGRPGLSAELAIHGSIARLLYNARRPSVIDETHTQASCGSDRASRWHCSWRCRSRRAPTPRPFGWTSSRKRWGGACRSTCRSCSRAMRLPARPASRCSCSRRRGTEAFAELSAGPAAVSGTDSAGRFRLQVPAIPADRDVRFDLRPRAQPHGERAAPVPAGPRGAPAARDGSRP